VSSSHSTLVLNATYEPLGVVSERRALILVLNQRATMVEESQTVLHYAGGALTLPSVIKLVKFVRIPYRHSVPLSRRALFARDGGKCVYCQAPATSIDHVIPRSRGGGHNWENVVSACHKCNHHKADKTLKEIGWKLRTLPREPAGAAWRILGSGKPDSRWISYLTPFGAENEVVA
jgi:5-methylcytosine-specific restriction endonuclease McrA